MRDGETLDNEFSIRVIFLLLFVDGDSSRARATSVKVETAKVGTLGNSHLLENDSPCETARYGSTSKCDSVVLVLRDFSR